MADKPRRWWVAALLSVLSLGLGQLYNGQPRKTVLFSVLMITLFGLYAVLVNTGFFLQAMLGLVAAGLLLWLAALADAIVHAKRQASYELKPYNRVIVYLGVGLAIYGVYEVAKSIVKEHHVQVFRLPSNSMSPTLMAGDYVVADKSPAARKPSRGDIAVFRFPQDSRLMYLDRVVGLAGDTLELRDKELLVGGRAVPEPYTVHLDSNVRPAGADPRDNFGPTIVPASSYFVMGDNRENSNDSRYWGPLGERDVIGRVRGIYFSWDRDRGRIRWERIGRPVK